MSSYQLKMEESFEVKRTKADCFRYITDFSTIWEWDHTVIQSEKTSDGPIEKGTIFDIVLKFGVRKTPMKYQITEYNFPDRAVLVGEADGFTAIDTVEIISINKNTTKVVWKAEITFKGAMAKVMPYIEGQIKKNGTKTIEGLKTALEDNYDAPTYKSSLKIADSLVLPGMFLFTKYGYQLAKKDWQPVSASVAGKQIILTGATSGLGLAAAHELAHKGAHLTLVARNKAKADLVKDELIRVSGNDNIEIEIADLSLMKHVDQLSDRLLARGKSIDVLINNAGALFNDRKLTSEGIERSFALLLLAPYKLTEQLMPLLQKSEDARVINVSSGGMYSQALRINDLEFKKGKYDGSIAYARAKRGLMIITEQWAEKYKDSNITFTAMHPGWADTPGVEDALPGFYKITKNVLRTPKEGADTIVWLAIATEAAKLSGKFLLDRRPHTTHLLPNTKAKKEDRINLQPKLNEYLSALKEVATVV
ncbi:MAG: SDR family NAD(P)-dependent oxidoreductase [Chitinophagales bacterium]